MALKKKQKPEPKKPAKAAPKPASKGKPQPKAKTPPPKQAKGKPAVKAPAKAAPAKSAQKKAAVSVSDEGFRLVLGRESLETRIRETLLLLHDQVGFEAANILATGADGKVRLIAAAHDDEILVLPEAVDTQTVLPAAPEILPQNKLKVWIPTPAPEDGSEAPDIVTPLPVAGLSGLIVPFKAGEDRTGALVLAGHGTPAYVDRDIETSVILTLNLALSFAERYFAGFQEARALQTQKASDDLKALRKSLNDEIHALKARSEESAQSHHNELTRLRTELETSAREALKSAEQRAAELEKTLHSETSRLEHEIKEERARRDEAISAARKELEHKQAEERKAHAAALENAGRDAQKQIQELNQLLAMSESDIEKKEKAWTAEKAQWQAQRTKESEEAQREKNRLQAELEKLTAESQAVKRSLESTSAKAGEGESRLRTLEKENSDLAERLAKANSALEAEKAGAAKARESAQSDLNRTRGDLESKLAAAQKRVQELSENLGPMESQLADVRQTLERERAKVTAGEESLKQAQAQAAKAADDLQKQIATLKNQIESKDRAIASARTDFEKESAAATAHTAALEKRIQELEQRETRYLQESYEAIEKASTAESALERERRENAETKRTLEAQLKTLSDESQRQKRDLENRSLDLQKELAAAEAREKALKGEIEDLSRSVSEEKSNVVRLESEKSAAIASREKTAGELATFEARAQAEREQMSAQFKEAIGRVEAELAETRQTLADSKAQTAELERIGAGLRTEISAVKSQKEETENQLKLSYEKQRELRGEIDARDEIIREMEAADERLKQELKKAQSDLEEMRQTEARLRQEIGMQRERALRLEQAIAGLEEEKHGLKNDITGLREALSNQKKESDALKRTIESLTDQLEALRKSERRLSEELSTAQARERGSRDEGRVLAEITGTLARIPDLENKLIFMTEQLKERVAIERLFMYSCPTESTVRVEEAYWGGAIPDIRGRTVPLRRTVFGEPLASRKGRTFEDQEDADMPEEIRAAINSKDKTEPAHYFIVPLAEADKAFGLLTVATTKKLTDPQIRLVEHIAPILGVALKFELNRTTLADAQSRRSHLDEVSHYLEARFAKSVTEALRAGPGGEEKRETMPLVAQMLPDVALETGLEGLADELPKWTERLAAKATARGMHTNVDFNEDVLGELSARIGPALRHVYWLIAEAVDNVIQHSQARKLDVTLERSEDLIRLSITDDGEGLIRTAGTENPKKGTGLTAIRNLAGAAGAQASFPRSANGGLSVRITWKM